MRTIYILFYILQRFYNHVAANITPENLLTGEPSLDDILMERNPVYGAGPQPPTSATGGDGVVVLENPAYSVPRDLQPAPDTQSPTATTGADRQQKNNGEYDPVDI